MRFVPDHSPAVAAADYPFSILEVMLTGAYTALPVIIS